MKRIMPKIVLNCLVLFLLMNSCIIGEIADKDEYASHKLVYEYSESAIYEMLYSLDLAVRVSAYANATTDSARNAIIKAYFSSDKITQTSEAWAVANKCGEWLFQSNGLPIEQQGAEWEIALSKNSGKEVFITSGDFQIKATGYRNWSLQLNDIGSEITDRLESSAKYDYYFDFTSYGNYSIAASEPDSIQPFFYDYDIESGNGGFVPKKIESGHYNVTVNYSVESPLSLRYDTSEYIFTDGTLLLNVVDSEDSTVESFKATVNTVPGNWNVTFK
ncbi:MAG: hypothetical protein H6Q14_2536 [Bacteroidetes bacterium]|nr:hypothetical protein [Bacteroidota bacterium]